MKKASIVFLAILMIVMSLPIHSYALEKYTPSGVAYTNIKTTMDSYINSYKEGLVSVETSVFDETGILYTGYYGYSDIENEILANQETVYEWGSTSKLLVWVSIMQLKEQGKLDFSTDIREYLPKGFLTKLQYKDEPITLLNLMNHNAGFQESIYENQQASEADLYDSLENALKKCECYQAYHVGEHTAYSNWGTALAAYIVERVSGMNYVDYVQQNIFEPLGMKHTAIDMHLSDNKWVRKQRDSLKCYARYTEEQYNEDYGVCHSWVQLFPAGGAVGTIHDLAIFAQGFVAEDCPFFKRNETREEMFTATSFYGDSSIVKNCHGLWTSQFKIQTLGHAGNTGGCTANLQFDPINKLGIVVLTNEPGESMLCTGLASLLFGDVLDSKIVKNNPVTEHDDMRGCYVPTRTVAFGFGRATHFAGGFFLTIKTDHPDIYKMPLTGGIYLIHIGNNMWLQRSESGVSQFMYESTNTEGKKQLEMMSTDMILDKGNIIGTVAYLVFILFGVVCLIILVINLLIRFIMRLCKKEKRLAATDKIILLQMLIQGVSGVILFSLISAIGTRGTIFAIFSCIMVIMLLLVSLLNGIVLFYNAHKNKKLGNYVWSFICIGYVSVVIWFQLYDFIHI